MKVHYVKDSRTARVCMCQHAGRMYIVSHRFSDGCWTVRPFSDSWGQESVSAEDVSQILYELSKQKAARFSR